MHLMAIPGIRLKHSSLPRCSRVQSTQNQAESSPQATWGGKVLGLVIPHTHTVPHCLAGCGWHSKAVPAWNPRHLARSPLCSWMLFGNIQSSTHLKVTLSPRQLSICDPQALPKIKDQRRSRGTSSGLQQHEGSTTKAWTLELRNRAFVESFDSLEIYIFNAMTMQVPLPIRRVKKKVTNQN